MWGALASAAGSVLGNVAGSWLSGKSNEEAANKNAEIQRELAQNGLSWRVADARKAGINPLAALGASIPSGQPIAVGTDYGDLGLGRAGQDISRAMQAGMTKEQREIHELNKRRLEAEIHGLELENKSKMVGTPPPLPNATFPNIGGSGHPGYDVVKDQVVTSNRPGVESAPKPMYQDVIDDEGNVKTIPTDSKGDLIESYTPLYVSEMLRNFKIWGSSYISMMSEKHKKMFAQYLLNVRPIHERPGWEYRWDLSKQVWVPTYVGKGNSYLYTEPLKDQSGLKFKFPNRR